MKTQALLVLLLSAGMLNAADDPYANVRRALAQNQLDAADAALAPLVAGEKPEPQALLYLSQVRARQRQTKEAVALAERAAAAEPTVAEYQSNLGSILGQRSGEVSFMHQALIAPGMLRAFRKSVELDPNHVPGHIGLARYYTFAPAIAGGSREAAEREAAEVEKRSAELGVLEYANIAEHFGDLPRARECYAKAAAAQPKAAWIEEALGRISEKQQQPAEARAHYEKALALDPARNSAKDALARLAAAKS